MIGKISNQKEGIMKKYVFLTSMLALAACGGGSGGGGAGGTASNTPQPLVRVPTELGGRVTATDNDVITSMKSEVVVASNSSTDLTRTPHTVEIDGVTFKSYRLEDIKLFAADAIHTHDGYLQIGMDENTGRIENIKMVVGGGAADAVPVARMGSTTKFNSPIFEYVSDSYARVNGVEFSVANNANAIRDAIAEGYHFEDGGTWIQQPSGDWKYRRTDGNWIIINGEEFSVANDNDALLDALKHANNFDGGKWVEDNGNMKYIEYGDEAIYRIVDTGQTKQQLDDLANDEHFTLGHWNRLDEYMDVVTYGHDIGNGKSLQYSDFGHFNPIYKTKLVDLTDKVGQDWNSEDAEQPHSDDEMITLMQEEDYQLFAGGYAINGTTLQDSLDTPNNTTFKGMAIGRVYTSLQGGDYNARKTHFNTYGIADTGDYNDGHDIAKKFTTQDATLVVDANGKQTLTMPFNTHAVGDKYYDVKLVKNADGTIDTPEFTGNEADIASQYRLYGALNHIVPGENSVNIGYYGVNNASEAAGTARLYSEHDLDGVVSREYEVQAAYGMKRQ